MGCNSSSITSKISAPINKFENPTNTAEGKPKKLRCVDLTEVTTPGSNCRHESVVEAIEECRKLQSDAFKSSVLSGRPFKQNRKGHWTECHKCRVLFYVKSDGYYEAVPLLMDPSISSSLASRRVRVNK